MLQNFIKKANEIHNYKYDYVKSTSINLVKKLVIICQVHGEFTQRVDTHLRGDGCPKCGYIDSADKNKIKTDEFILRSKVIHNNKYNYDKSHCDGGYSLVDINCPVHGLFSQIASQHLKGSGCRACYVDSTRLSQDIFIQECILKHQGKYDYSLVEYNTIRDKIIVKCPEHGAFLQTAHDHKNGGGCPRCAEYDRNLGNKDPETPCYLYYLKLKVNELIFYKIGITTVSIGHRFQSLINDNVIIEEEYSFLTTLHKAINAEQQIIFEFSNHKLLMNDVLKHTRGGTECFADNIMALYNMSPEDFIE
ncbi:hypothetical protein [Shewanella sp. S1-49-MNA-CIBAN-0167]|uniref:hypothetical protein n=1 Tax=Shewanella sp. S1-49-MNA-CIBAN-0167 TaxID=3140468 RepID=UPI00331E83E9